MPGAVNDDHCYGSGYAPSKVTGMYAPAYPVPAPSYLYGESQHIVVMPPGKMPTHIYQNGNQAVIMEPGKMPTHVYGY